MSDSKIVWNTSKKILQSMKTQERVSTRVRPEYFLEKDAEKVAEHGILKDRVLIIDIDMKSLIRVDDVYRDLTTFHKTIKKGSGTASPFSDFLILSKHRSVCVISDIVKVRIQIDGQVKFEHPRFDDLSEIEVGVDVAKYDMEEYQVPPVITKLLKTTKMNEVFQIRTTRKDKALSYFKDSNNIFDNDLISSFKNEVVFTVCLVAFEQKDFLFKLPIAEKL